MKTKILRRIILCTTMGILPLQFVQGQVADESPCNRHYEAAIKFIVDTPKIHPFTVSKDAITGKTGRVIFSSANLQYSPNYQYLTTDDKGVTHLETTKDFFRFAPRQIDRCMDGRDFSTASEDDSMCFGNVSHYEYIESPPNSGHYISTSKKSTSVNNTDYPSGPSADYHGWIDLFTFGSSCQGKRAKDPLTTHFVPYDQCFTNYGNGHNNYLTGPSYYVTPDVNNPEGWRTDVRRNNIDTNSGPSRYFDWGYANIIQEYKTTMSVVNGFPIQTIDSTCYRPGVWRLLTADEWTYLLTNRLVENSTASWSICSVEDTSIHSNGDEKYIGGMLLYPDDFNASLYSVPHIPRYGVQEADASFTGDLCHDNKLTYTQLQDFIAAGCVFLVSCYRGEPDLTLPLGGSTDFLNVYYWSSTTANASTACRIRFVLATGAFTTSNVATRNNFSRAHGFGVRLVQDL